MTVELTEIHPLALEYPALSDDDLGSMSADIAANGQHDPIICDQHGRLIDGRNRLEACRRAEAEPVFVTREFADEDEIAAFILSVNVEKRSLSNGQKAMFRACDLVRQKSRVAGRWKRGSIDNPEFRISSGWVDLMTKAGLVLDVAARAAALGPEYALFADQPAQVKNGTLTLDAAHRIAQDFESKAAMQEMAIWLPFTKASGQLEQLSIEASQAIELPIVGSPLKKPHRTQLEETAKRFNAVATAIRAYLKENA